MLARCYSLKGKDSFQRVEKEGKIFQSDSFGLAYLSRGDKELSNFGFIVSTKVSKESVLRNRIKRAMSEAIRFLLTEVKPGYDVIFLAKQRGLKKTTDEIMKEVSLAMKKAGLTK